jgi:hypothetical protein
VRFRKFFKTDGDVHENQINNYRKTVVNRGFRFAFKIFFVTTVRASP